MNDVIVKLMSDSLDFNTKKVENCIVPVFIREGTDYMKFVGSAVYLYIDNDYFLATAKHVVADNPANLVIPVDPESFNCIPTDRFIWAENDQIDVAVAKLSAPLNLFIPLTLKQILNTETCENLPNKLIALGFPGTKVKTYNGQAKGLLKKFASNEAPRKEYKRMAIDPRIGIVIDFNQNEVLSAIKGFVKFPLPNGMSGGGLFWMHKKRLFDKNKPVLLVGILTDWDAASKKNMKATKIKFVMKIIEEAFAKEIPEHLTRGIKIVN